MRSLTLRTCGSTIFLSEWHCFKFRQTAIKSAAQKISNSSNSHSPWYFTDIVSPFLPCFSTPKCHHIRFRWPWPWSWMIQMLPGPRGRQDSFRSSSGDLAVQGGLVIHGDPWWSIRNLWMRKWCCECEALLIRWNIDGRCFRCTST